MERKTWIYLAVIWGFLALVVIGADLCYFNPRDLRLSPYTYDPNLGWLPKRDFSRNFPQKDAAGNRYDALLTLDRHRFRAYGDPRSASPKILVLGDSYTGDPFTGNREMYFSVLKASLKKDYGVDAEIFAVGGGGYGTLQEYLLVKEHIKAIKPDIFVLQFSDNDFPNNLYEWESSWIVKNQSFYRPYYSLKTGAIFHSPSPYAAWYKFAYNNSYFFRRLAIMYQNLQYRHFDGYGREFTAKELARFHADSYAVTKKLLTMLKNEFSPQTKLFIMLDNTEDAALNGMQAKLAGETGFTPLAAPVDNLNRYEAQHKSEVLRHADGGHLNILGNRILGEQLAAELARQLHWQRSGAGRAAFYE